MYLGRRETRSSAHTGPAQAPVSPQFAGAGSCSASACHNGYFSHSSTRQEYTTWITRDSHAKAYEVLFAERAQQIQKNLHQTVSAHEDQRCLSCHVAPDFDVKKPPTDASYFKTDGVSCESCHGPAKAWLPLHHLDAWQVKTPAQKKRLGMNDTQSLTGRAQLCVQCHVGAPGMDVDHDLIAAGHPRLHFEFAAFHAHMPRHWPDAKDRVGRPNFEARVWVIGQLVTAHATLDLLAYRADEKYKKAWPEFTEFDCAACHHDLQSPSGRQKAGYGTRKPGAYPWGHSVGLTPIALGLIKDADRVRVQEYRDQIEILQKMFDAGNPRREAVAALARKAAAHLKEMLGRLDQNLADVMLAQEKLQKLLDAQGAKGAGPSDEVTQISLGLVALHTAGTALPKGVRDLKLPRFDPEAIRARLSPFHSSKGP